MSWRPLRKNECKGQGGKICQIIIVGTAPESNSRTREWGFKKRSMNKLTDNNMNANVECIIIEFNSS